MEKILAKHGIDPLHTFYLRLSNIPYMDLVMERYDNTIIVGHNYVQNSDLMGDPILTMEEMNGYWSPLFLEQMSGDSVA